MIFRAGQGGAVDGKLEHSVSRNKQQTIARSPATSWWPWNDAIDVHERDVVP
jgi:hypothetical protein